MAKMFLKLCVLLSAFIINIDALSHSEDNILYFFPQAQRDGLNIVWAHDLNSNTKLTRALEGNAMMLEADVSLRDRGTANQVPIMAPSSMSVSDITLEQWIDMVTRYTNKGIVLDFKDVQAVQPALDIMLLKEAQLRVPLFFHADIIAGPNGQNSVNLIQPTEFVAIVNAVFPNATFSLGYVSEVAGVNRQDRYTWTMIFDMLDASSTVTTHPITYNFRAIWATKSWQKFVWILGLTNRYSVTIWSKVRDPLTNYNGLEQLRSHGDKRRIFYDLAPDHIKRLKSDVALIPPTTSTPKVWNKNLWEGNSSTMTGGYIYLSTEGAAIVGDSYSGYIQTIDNWKSSKDGRKPLIVKGKVQFVNRNVQSSPGPSSAEIIIRAAPMTNGAVIVPIKGIKCAIEDNGRILIQDLMSHHSSLEKRIRPADCYTFEILDNGQQITFNVKIAQCSDADFPPTYIDNGSLVFDNVTNTANATVSLVQVAKGGNNKNIVLEDFSIMGEKFIRIRNRQPGNTAVESRPAGLTIFLTIISFVLLKIFS